MKTEYVFYAVRGGPANDVRLARGLFNLFRDAKGEAEKHLYAVVSRHVEREDKLVNYRIVFEKGGAE
jgi:hypothetical protein